jgi:hypothetical protein
MRNILSLQIDNLVFDGTNYIIEKIDGLEMPLTRLPRFNLPGASGAFISNALYGERPIKIKGYVNAPDNSRLTYLTNRSNLVNNITYKRDSNGNLVPQLMTITLENGTVLTTEVYQDTVLQFGYSPDQDVFEEFQMTMIAPDPFLYSTSVISTTISLPIGGGTAIPTAIPISIAPSSGGSATITNPGSQLVSPLITLYAPLTNPYISNNTVGSFMKLNHTLSVGDLPVIINCAAQTIYQGANNITGIQSQDSTFWQITSGVNNLGFSATAGSGTVVVSFSPTFLGI